MSEHDDRLPRACNRCGIMRKVRKDRPNHLCADCAYTLPYEARQIWAGTRQITADIR